MTMMWILLGVFLVSLTLWVISASKTDKYKRNQSHKIESDIEWLRWYAKLSTIPRRFVSHPRTYKRLPRQTKLKS